jgi:hypothetical protein
LPLALAGRNARLVDGDLELPVLLRESGGDGCLVPGVAKGEVVDARDQSLELLRERVDDELVSGELAEASCQFRSRQRRAKAVLLRSVLRALVDATVAPIVRRLRRRAQLLPGLRGTRVSILRDSP